MHSCVVRFKGVIYKKSTKEFSYMAIPYVIVSRPGQIACPIGIGHAKLLRRARFFGRAHFAL